MFKYWFSCYGLPLIFLVIFFYPVFLGGEYLVPNDLYFSAAPYKFLKLADEVQIQNRIFGDVILHFYPWRRYLERSLRDGFIPIWNPYSYCGSPFLANLQSAVLYPPNWLTIWFHSATVFTISAILKLYLAYLFTFLFIKNLGCRVFGCILGGLAFMFSGSLIGWLQWPHTNASTLLPCYMWLLYRLWQSKRSAYIVGLAICLYWMISGGHVESALHVFTTGILFWTALSVKALWFKENHSFIRRQARMVLGMLLGNLMAMPVTLPFSEYLVRSVAFARRSHGMASAVKADSLWGFLVHNIYGHPILENYFGRSSIMDNIVYVGVIPLMLAVYGLCRGYRKPIVWYFTAVLVLGICGSVRVPFLHAFINNLPFYKPSFNLRHFIMVEAFCLSILCGLGATHLQSDLKASRSWIARGILLIITCLYCIGIYLAWRHFQPIYERLDMYSQAVFWYGLSGVILAVCFIALMYFTWKRAGGVWSAGLLIALSFTDIFIFRAVYTTSVPWKLVEPRIPIIEHLKSGDDSQFRFLSIGQMYYSNISVNHGLLDMNGHDAMTYVDFPQYFSLIEEPTNTGDNPRTARYHQHPAAGWAGVKYYLAQHQKAVARRFPSEFSSYQYIFKKRSGFFHAKKLAVYGRFGNQTDNVGRYLEVTAIRNDDSRIKASFKCEGHDDYGGEYFSCMLFELPERIDIKGFHLETKNTDLNMSVRRVFLLDPAMRLVFDSGGVIYLNEWYTPRFFKHHHPLWFADQNSVLVALGQRKDWRAPCYVVEKKDKPTVQLPNAGSLEDGSADGLQVNEISGQHITVNGDFEVPGFLVASNTYYPGWKVLVDGQEKPLYRTNYLFMSVAVDAGRHLVEFVYDPMSFRLGLFLMVLGVCGCVGIMLILQ